MAQEAEPALPTFKATEASDTTGALCREGETALAVALLTAARQEERRPGRLWLSKPGQIV